MLISEIVWGDDSAEKDPNLLDYFVLPTTVKRLGDFNKSFIVGRKGSGKSAILRELNHRLLSDRRSIIIDIRPSFYSMKNILSDEKLIHNFGEEIFFQYAWMKHLLYKAVVAFGNLAQGKYIKGSYEFARNTAKRDTLTSPDLVEVIAELFSKLKVKGGKLGDLGLTMERDLKVLTDVSQFIFHVRNITDKGNFKVIYLVDDLDILWNNSRASNNILLGLLSCANAIQSLSENIHLFISIREDVYKILLSKTQHSDKYRNVELLRWEKEELKEILERRIKFNYKEGGTKIHGKSAFYSVFPEKVNGENTVDWMVNRTLGRPRELIQLSRIYTERNERNTPSEKALRASELVYSEWKLDDLCNEYMYQYPGMRELLDCWKIISKSENFSLSRDQFDSLFLKLIENYDTAEGWYYRIKNDLDSRSLLLTLYEMGFIGDVVRTEEGRSSVYSTNTTHKPVFSEIEIHPCFRESMKAINA